MRERWFDFRLPSQLHTRFRRLFQRFRSRSRYWLNLPTPGLGDVEVAMRFRHPIDWTKRFALTSRYRHLFPESACSEISEGQRLARHSFSMLGHKMSYGQKIAWCRDPVSGRDWDLAFSPDISYRGEDRLGDIKIPWELNKHQYLFTLGKTAWLLNDPAFAMEIMWQIDDWIEANPWQRGINWISALEIGTRAVSWIMAYPFYNDICDAAFRKRLFLSLAQHMLFIEKHLSTDRFANTHLIGEAAALAIGGLFLDCRRSPSWLKKGLSILEEEMERQVTPDGAHAERSIAYHQFFLDHYYLVTAFLEANGLSFSAKTKQSMEKMTGFLLDILFPDGSAPAFGDGDDARGIWCRAGCPNEFRSLLALGAVVFGRPDFKAGAAGMKEELFWLFGNEGVDKFNELKTQSPDHTSAAYPNSGYYIMRGGWSSSDSVLVFDCGPLGFGSAGHGHSDALSFQLYAGEYPFLVDSGTYSYNLDYAWRDAFRSTRAHNTVIVDGDDQSALGTRMSWQTMATSVSHRWVTTQWFDVADGEHNGYCRLSKPVTHRRVVIFVKPETWWIWDNLMGIGRHDLEFLLHVRPDCSVETRQGGNGLLLQSPRGGHLHAWVMGKGSETSIPEVLVGSDEERSAWFSPGYGVRLSTRALRIKRRFFGQCSLVTCFSTSGRMIPTLVGHDGFIHLVMRREDQVETFFYCPQIDQQFKTEGILFEGELLYCRQPVKGLPILWAGNFRKLAATDLVDVRSPVLIHSLILEDDRCEALIAKGRTEELQATVRKGVRLEINRQHTNVSSMKN